MKMCGGDIERILVFMTHWRPHQAIPDLTLPLQELVTSVIELILFLLEPEMRPK